MNIFKKKKCKQTCSVLSALSLGIGLGILITYPLVGQHPVRWSVVFIVTAVIGYFYTANK